MSLYLDVEYAQRLCSGYRNFKKEGPYNFKFSCPICGDSDKNKQKARGNLWKPTKMDGLQFHCYNCGFSAKFSYFLKTQDINLYKQYRLDKFKNDGNEVNPLVKKEKPKKLKTKKPEKVEKRLLDKMLDNIASLPDDHMAVKFVAGRKIPKAFWEVIYYIPEIKDIAQLKQKYKEKLENCKEPRLIIPFYSRQGKLVGVTCRDLSGNDALQKYLTIKVDEDALQCFGLDTVDISKDIFVVEGPIDSMFLENGVGNNGSDLLKIAKVLPFSKVILVPDNQPRNREICKQILSFIKAGYRVCLWPESMKEKDINDMYLSGMSRKKIMKMIRDNTFQGMKAEMRFSTWKKVKL